MSALKWLASAIALFAGGLLVVAQFGALRGTPPLNLGVREGRLARPSSTPNSVSSQATLWPDHPQRDYAAIAPLPLRGDGRQTIARLDALLRAWPGATVVEHRPDYLYVQFSTRWLKFTDDAEFWYDERSGVVQVRSASRLGRRDFGVNRERIEAIRARLAASSAT